MGLGWWGMGYGHGVWRGGARSGHGLGRSRDCAVCLDTKYICPRNIAGAGPLLHVPGITTPPAHRRRCRRRALLGPLRITAKLREAQSEREPYCVSLPSAVNHHHARLELELELELKLELKLELELRLKLKVVLKVGLELGPEVKLGWSWSWSCGWSAGAGAGAGAGALAGQATRPHPCLRSAYPPGAPRRPGRGGPGWCRPHWTHTSRH